MHLYKKDNLEIISQIKRDEASFTPVSSLTHKEIYYLYSDQKCPLGVHLIHDIDFIEQHHQTLKNTLNPILDEQLLGRLIKEKRLIAVNEFHAVSSDIKPLKKGYKVHVLGLGDVGGIMLSGLRLLGGETLSEIGIFDLDENKVKRWIYELNQIKSIDRGVFPPIRPVSFDAIFDCDVFIFTASSQIPEVGSEVKDVRMYQLEKNAKIISIYVKKALEEGYKGQFVVVSDPVDLLCKAVLDYGKGFIKPEQIKGFGLGVMHARACYYGPMIDAEYYEENGRAFGPHGQHLVIADHMLKYDHEKSLRLTQKTVEANLDVRAVGYKPFIAPALSSAALSILAYLEGKDHYSTVYIDGAFFGCKNKASALNIFEIEKNEIPNALMARLTKTHKELKSFEF